MCIVITCGSFSSPEHLFTTWDKQFNQDHILLVYVTIFRDLHFFLAISFVHNAMPK